MAYTRSLHQIVMPVVHVVTKSFGQEKADLVILYLLNKTSQQELRNLRNEAFKTI